MVLYLRLVASHYYPRQREFQDEGIFASISISAKFYVRRVCLHSCLAGIRALQSETSELEVPQLALRASSSLAGIWLGICLGHPGSSGTFDAVPDPIERQKDPVPTSENHGTRSGRIDGAGIHPPDFMRGVPPSVLSICLGFIFLLEPVNYRLGLESLLAEAKKQNGNRILCWLLAGLTAGVLWEALNYWAGSHWEYTIPYLNFCRIFQMPVFGYGGFLPFAIEVFAMYSFLGFI